MLTKETIDRIKMFQEMIDYINQPCNNFITFNIREVKIFNAVKKAIEQELIDLNEVARKEIVGDDIKNDDKNTIQNEIEDEKLKELFMITKEGGLTSDKVANGIEDKELPCNELLYDEKAIKNAKENKNLVSYGKNSRVPVTNSYPKESIAESLDKAMKMNPITIGQAAVKMQIKANVIIDKLIQWGYALKDKNKTFATEKGLNEGILDNSNENLSSLVTQKGLEFLKAELKRK